MFTYNPSQNQLNFTVSVSSPLKGKWARLVPRWTNSLKRGLTAFVNCVEPQEQRNGRTLQGENTRHIEQRWRISFTHVLNATIGWMKRHKGFGIKNNYVGWLSWPQSK